MKEVEEGGKIREEEKGIKKEEKIKGAENGREDGTVNK